MRSPTAASDSARSRRSSPPACASGGSPPRPGSPPSLVKLKQAADLHTSSLSQRIIADLVHQPGWFHRHVERITPIYAGRSAALAASLRSHLADRLSFAEPSGGMFLWATLAGGGDAEALLPPAVDAGVAFVPGSAFGVDPAGRHRDRMRLSFATLNPDDLDEAVRRLAKVLG